jgi:N-acetylmuramoyl-L-alanine amidase
VYLALLLGAALAGGLPARADDAADRRAAAQAQFARAEELRAALEAKPERQRSLDEYTRVASAYRRVYMITPHAVEVPAAIKQAADLYSQMGNQFESKYFRSALTTYEFLVRDYPASRYQQEAQLAIAALHRDSLGQPDLAKKAYEEFLKQHPRSPRASEARAALAEMAALEKKSPAATPAAVAQSPTPAGSSAPDRLHEIGQVRVWNADTYTRVIIDLGAQAKYQAARISGPDRIYFDIENAQLNPKLAAEPVEIPSNGYLKTVRIAQNRANVVRVVLEVDKVKDYSVFELANPDRLVVDVYGSAPSTTTLTSAPAVQSVPAAKAEPAGKAASNQPVTVATNREVPGGKSAPAVREVRAGANAKNAVDSRPTAAAGNATRVNPDAGRNAAGNPAPPAPLLSAKQTVAAMGPTPVAQPTRAGGRSLTRVLGLKVGRIVIDAGHGGHDTGTIGPTGLMEKDLSLDVSLRLGRIIQERLPVAEITYTRNDDSFIALEQRTAIANDARADLLISIHANSSSDRKVRGIETYYLNFNASPAAMEVAARENALAQRGVHQLEELVQKIARNEKIEESRDLAMDVQDSLAKQTKARGLNRGVRKAPFVILIGANMPSVLSEISFLSNPADEQWLKKPENRQRVAEGIYGGIEKYLQSTNSLAINLAPAERADAVAASDDAQ